MMTGMMAPRPKGLVSYWGYGDVDGEWYTRPSEHYRKAGLISKEEAYEGMTQQVVASETKGQGLDRGRLYHYYRQNGLWTKEVTGIDPAVEKGRLDAYCPVRNITESYPPMMMIHGTGDTDVPCEKSVEMAEQLRKHKVRCELVLVEGAGHVLYEGAKKEEVERARGRAREFIRQALAGC